MFHFYTPLKPLVYWRFQGVQKQNIGLKCLNSIHNINIIILTPCSEFFDKIISDFTVNIKFVSQHRSLFYAFVLWWKDLLGTRLGLSEFRLILSFTSVFRPVIGNQCVGVAKVIFTNNVCSRPILTEYHLLLKIFLRWINCRDFCIMVFQRTCIAKALYYVWY